MISLKRASAVAAAAVSLAVAGTAPAAHAQEFDLYVSACHGSVTLPGCVDWTFDTAQNSIESGRYVYNNTIQPTLDGGACAAYEILTGDPCPTKGMVPKL